MQEVADWRFAVFAAPEPGHISFDRIVDRSDCPVGNGNADQDAHDRLDHRLRKQPVPVGSRILIVLEENAVVFGDEEACDRIP